ncbi:hypothetical protein P4O66_005442, partial [Electrophorus voltai]
RLYHLRRLRDFRLPSKVLRNFYTCTIESILTGNITVWFGNSTKQDRQALQRVVRSAERITHSELPDLQTTYYQRLEYGGEIRIKPGLRKYACDVTLDPNTANRDLSLSEGNRKVTCVREQQPYPDHAERFDVYNQVVCRESLTAHCYWEAEWRGGGHVSVCWMCVCFARACLLYVDCDRWSSVGKIKEAACSTNGSAGRRLDVWHFMREFAAGVTTDSHQL